MAQDTRQTTPNQPDCKKDPAGQPPDAKLPTDDSCKPLDIGRTPPKLCARPDCSPCCTCPPGPGDQSTCLDGLIRSEADAINKGEQAKKFKADLEALLGKVKAATLEYTPDNYKDLVERWKKEDDAIVCLIRSIDCALPCWTCVIECEICTLVYGIHNSELGLTGNFQLAGEPPFNAAAEPPCVKSLYDLRYWWWREKLRRETLFSHVAGVMKAWETPFKTIDGILKSNAEIIKTIAAALNIDQKKDAAKYLFDLVRLIRQHMDIAPPAAAAVTGIDKRYVNICCCDQSPPLHECCGVIIRVPTVLDRVVGPLPYLVKPEKYADLICCLATRVYQPVKKSAVEADSRHAELDTMVKDTEAAIAAQFKSLPADAKVRLGKTIDCKDYKPKSGTDPDKPKCCTDPAPPPCGDEQPKGGDPGQKTPDPNNDPARIA